MFNTESTSCCQLGVHKAIESAEESIIESDVVPKTRRSLYNIICGLPKVSLEFSKSVGKGTCKGISSS